MNPRPKSNWHALSATGGSLVVCLVTPSAVYLSADSRYAHAPLGLRDSARKLIACGRTALCGLSGLLRFTRTECDRSGDHLPRHLTFELSDVIEGLHFEDAAGSEPALAVLFAERLHLALAPIWERFAVDLDEPFGGTTAHSRRRIVRLAELFYLNRDVTGRAFLATIDLTHSLFRSDSGRYSGVLEAPLVHRLFFGAVIEPRLYLRGTRGCVRSAPVCGAVDGDVDALRIIEGVFQSARFNTRCAAVIGGPVDIAVIDTAGRRWLRQKCECRIPADRNHGRYLNNGPILRE